MPTNEIPFRDYEAFVRKLFKEMGTDPASLMHAAVGISGEAGELLDAIKKHWVYNKHLDIVNVEEELGDIIFYMTWMIKKLGLTWPQIIAANIAKLRKRYPTGYTDQAAQQRADKQ